MNYRELFPMRRLWLIFALTLIVMFGALLIVGGVSFRVKPPLPDRVVYELDGSEHTIFTAEDIHDGRDVWRTLGAWRWALFGDMGPI